MLPGWIAQFRTFREESLPPGALGAIGRAFLPSALKVLRLAAALSQVDNRALTPQYAFAGPIQFRRIGVGRESRLGPAVWVSS